MKAYLFAMLCACVSLIASANEQSNPDVNHAMPNFEAHGVLGKKIAVADGYSVHWSNTFSPFLTSTDYDGWYIVDTVPRSIGWQSSISLKDNADYVIRLYDDFDVLLNKTESVRDNKEEFWFTAGALLASEESSAYIDANKIQIVTKTLYSVPENWLYDRDDTVTCKIAGTFNSECVLTFEGGVAFFIETQIIEINTNTGQEQIKNHSYTLSPVYHNIRFFNPNGVQECERYNDRYPAGPVWSSDMRDYVNTQEMLDQGLGHGGAVSRPVDPRPIKSRIHNVVPNNLLGSDRKETNNERFLLNEGDSFETETISVYLSQINDTTVYVYNLFGSISEVNVIYLHKDSTITCPVQPYDQSTEHSVYCFSDNSSIFDIAGTVEPENISWGLTLPVNYYGLFDYYYDSINLRFINGNKFFIPGSAIRGDVNRDGEVTIIDLTALIDHLLGDYGENQVVLGKEAFDCNQDDAISITDITAMIDYLLTGAW